jgi:hypothetical protein
MTSTTNVECRLIHLRRTELRNSIYTSKFDIRYSIFCGSLFSLPGGMTGIPDYGTKII